MGCCGRNSLLLTTLALTLAAALYPGPGASLYHVLDVPLLIVLFSCLGLTLNVKELTNALQACRIHFCIQVFSLILTPAAFYPVYASGLARAAVSGHKWLAVGLMVTACLPPPSNTHIMFTMQCGGDESIATINGAIGNTLGAIIAPVVAAYSIGNDRTGSSPPGFDFFFGIVLHILVPLFVGVLLQSILPLQRLRPALRELATLVLVVFLYLVFCSAFDTDSDLDLPTLARLGLVVLGIHLVILSAAWLVSVKVARTPERRVAFVFTSSQKTEGLGIAIVAHFNASAALSIVAYHTIQMIVAAILVPRFKSWIDRTRVRDLAVGLLVANAALPQQQQQQPTPVAVAVQEEGYVPLDQADGQLFHDFNRTRGSSLDDEFASGLADNARDDRHQKAHARDTSSLP